jgi:hypothetical protein
LDVTLIKLDVTPIKLFAGGRVPLVWADLKVLGPRPDRGPLAWQAARAAPVGAENPTKFVGLARRFRLANPVPPST